MLEQGKEQSAKIRVEIIIQEDINNELLEILELYCELLLARSALLDQRECDPGLEEAVKTIIYSATRTEVKELHQVRELLMHKFGKEFAENAIENADEIVPEKVMKRLSTAPPSPDLVNLYLVEIAKTYHAPYSGLPQEPPSDDNSDQDGGAKEPSSPIAVSVPAPTTDNVHPTLKLNDQKPLAQAPSSGDAELDALKERFQALRRR